MSIHKPRGYSVNDFLSWHQREELVLQPKFQRRDVWSSKAKSHLLDTILRGLPAPLIFIRQQIDPAKKKTIREVVDGQQRLRAVLEFCDPKDPTNAFTLHKAIHPNYGGKTFADLPSEVQQAFLSYEFSVVLLEGASDADVLNIFARLNTYAQKLTAQELLNAAYFGQFKQTVYRLGYEHLNFWRDKGILTDKQIIRMAEAELVSELVVAMMDGPQNKKENLKKFYEQYDEEFNEKAKIEKEFRDTIDVISQVYGNDLRHSIFSRRIIFYSLFLVFFDLLFALPKSPVGKPTVRIVTGAFPKLRDALNLLDKDYKTNKSSLADFITFSTISTADRRERTIRHKVIYDRLRAVV